ncbi:MAG: DUF1648 domain-containing protein [Ktedonobacterales bacterium]
MNVLSALIPLLICGLVLLLYWFIPELSPSGRSFGVRIPPEHQADPAIVHERRQYRLALLVIAALMGILNELLLSQDSSGLTNLLPLLTVILGILDYTLAYRHLVQIKATQGWYLHQRQAVVVETERATSRVPFPFLWLIPSLALLCGMIVLSVVRYPALPATIPVQFDLSGQPTGWANKMPGAFVPVFLALLETILSTTLAWFLPRTRLQLDPAEPHGSLTTQRLLRHNWARLLLVLAACGNASFLLASLVSWGILPTAGTLAAVASFVPLLLIAIVLILFLLTQRSRAKAGVPTDHQLTGSVYRDDDQYWQGGLFYSNPDDPALFVEKRDGLGWTVNFGHPQGKLFMIGLLVVIVVMSILPTLFQH